MRKLEEKHFFVTEYIKLSHGPRQGFLGPGKSGAAYIDLFCGPGQSKIKDTTQYADGAAVAAWKVAKEKGSPFSAVYIADKDAARRGYCAMRLRAVDAPVTELQPQYERRWVFAPGLALRWRRRLGAGVKVELGPAHAGDFAPARTGEAQQLEAPEVRILLASRRQSHAEACDQIIPEKLLTRLGPLCLVKYLIR